MFKYIILLIFLLTFAVLLTECQSPANTDNQIIIPADSATISFVNAMPDIDLDIIYVKTGRREIDTIKYSSKPPSFEYNYKPVGVSAEGIKNVIHLISAKQNSLIFKSMIDLEIGSKYLFIAYGSEYNVQSIMLEDSIINYEETNVYIRCVNASPNAPVLTIKVYSENNSSEFILGRSEFSLLKSLPYEKYNIDITSEDSLFKGIHIKNYTFPKGHISNIILKGYYEKDINRLQLDIVKLKYE